MGHNKWWTSLITLGQLDFFVGASKQLIINISRSGLFLPCHLHCKTVSAEMFLVTGNEIQFILHFITLSTNLHSFTQTLNLSVIIDRNGNISGLTCTSKFKCFAKSRPIFYQPPRVEFSVIICVWVFSHIFSIRILHSNCQFWLWIVINVLGMRSLENNYSFQGAN